MTVPDHGVHATCLESTSNAPDSLRCEGYFWNEKNDSTTRGDDLLNRIKIHFSFARTRHAVQESHAKLVLLNRAIDRIHTICLFVSKRGSQLFDHYLHIA